MDPRSHRSCGWREQAVARTHGEPILFPDRGMRGDFYGDLQITDHPADDGELLPILLTEHGGIWSDDIEEHGDDRADTIEVLRSGAPAKSAGKSGLTDFHGRIPRIYLADPGMKEQIHPLSPAQVAIRFIGARIFREILVLSELRRVHKNRNRYLPIRSCKTAGPPDKCGMSGMQRSHGGYKNHGAANCTKPRTDGTDPGRFLHGTTWRAPQERRAVPAPSSTASGSRWDPHSS